MANDFNIDKAEIHIYESRSKDVSNQDEEEREDNRRNRELFQKILSSIGITTFKQIFKLA